MMTKPTLTLMEEYQEDLLPLDESGFPLANSFQRVWNVAKLAGREAERNIANVTGQASKVVGAGADVVNPFMTVDDMKQHTAAIDAHIENTLKSIDQRYADAIDAFWKSLQLTDTQVFLFMLNPALYLGTKTVPQAVAGAAKVLATAANNPNPQSKAYNWIQNTAKAATRATTFGGPGANQAASYSGGGYGAYDFGGDYGSDY